MTQKVGQVLDFQPPSKTAMRAMFAPLRTWFSPVFMGLEELDLQKPALFVGNHTIYGMTDATLMIEHLYTQHDLMLRSLGDRFHFNIPGWGKLLVKNGMVLGSPENCSTLMQAGRSILVFPGGGREVMRRKGEAYTLIWKKRTGFARLAIEHGYDIIPFASVGPDDALKILLDGNDVMATRLWQWLADNTPVNNLTRKGDMLPPLVRGIGPSMLPRPQRYYLGFGERIPTAQVQGRQDDADVAWAIREQVAAAIEDQIEQLKAYRLEDREQNWSRLRRWLAPIH